MYILCPKHGCGRSVLLSPDLEVKLTEEQKIDNVVKIRFESKNGGHDIFYLSPKYASDLGFNSSITLAIEDELPSWTDLFNLNCLDCFQSGLLSKQKVESSIKYFTSPK